MIKAKHQRLALILVAVAALFAASLLAAYALRSEASYFYVPSEMAADPPETGRAVRLGGMVQDGSLRQLADGVTVAFIVGDGDGTVPVRYSGILPDLFVEGSGVVADGRMVADGTFVADNLLARHDENYVPRELEDMAEHQARQTIAETTGGTMQGPQ